MRLENRIKSIIFDFDGVLVDSIDIRIRGFRKLLAEFDTDSVEWFITYHKINGGLSRYHKIRYFYQYKLGIPISEEKVQCLCDKFSNFVKDDIVHASGVSGAEDFLRDNFDKYDLFLVSGSDEKELREICDRRNISRYFKLILGSPKEKEENLKSLIKEYALDPQKTFFIGDSVNDMDAAQKNHLKFIARNSGDVSWVTEGIGVIPDLTKLEEKLKDCR